MLPLPPPSVLGPLVRSTLVIWLSCHLAAGIVLKKFAGAFWPTLTGSLFLVLLVPALLVLELRIQRLRVFLANLGASLPSVLFLAFLLALSIEIAAGSTLALFAPGPTLR